jgi:hypothetical protein
LDCWVGITAIDHSSASDRKEAGIQFEKQEEKERLCGGGKGWEIEWEMPKVQGLSCVKGEPRNGLTRNSTPRGRRSGREKAGM